MEEAARVPAGGLDPEVEEQVRAITRPERGLLTLYVLGALLSGPFFPIFILPLYFRYHTLRYRFDDDGISVSWGILFRREHHLTYARIQDIHVTRNFVERWLGIGTVSVQTASGSGSAEAEIVGVSAYDAIRDYLYTRMRGLGRADASEEPAPADDATAALLEEIRDALPAVRERLEAQGPAA